MTGDKEFRTIEQAKKHLRENWHTGTHCPCCGQGVKLYARQTYAAMAWSLIKLARLNQDNDDFIHISVIGTPKSGGGDFSKLKYWELIEPCMDEPEKGRKTTGKWRITEKGILFVHNKITIPKYCYTYNKKPRSFSAESISIIDALRNQFDYDELMEWCRVGPIDGH